MRDDDVNHHIPKLQLLSTFLLLARSSRPFKLSDHIFGDRIELRMIHDILGCFATLLTMVFSNKKRRLTVKSIGGFILSQ